MTLHSTLLALALTCAALASASPANAHEPGDAAIGEAGQADHVTRSVAVDMSDAMRFTPASIAAKQGETVRFVLHNSGQVRHEFVLGSMQELKEHAELMKKFPAMEHDEPNMVSVEPGLTGVVIWHFTSAGTVDFACLQPGHFDAGMKGHVTVAPDGRAHLPSRPTSQAAR